MECSIRFDTAVYGYSVVYKARRRGWIREAIDTQMTAPVGGVDGQQEWHNAAIRLRFDEVQLYEVEVICLRQSNVRRVIRPFRIIPSENRLIPMSRTRMSRHAQCVI